ncbi:2-polyprenyl-6-methoxyphenol hydroxylase-like oxidoreductase [Prauserella sp. Am3]|nr:2-polyprenyl-6-methoxyphenol hydroxylase-like oxidoreductase [Prauserella sp. Am3]
MRILVCGAGIAGLASAWWLTRDGHEVVVVERAPARRRAGYMIDCQGAGYDTAQRMGLLPQLWEHAVRLSSLIYHDDDGHVRGQFTEEDSDSGRVVSLMRGDLERILSEKVDVPIRFAASVADIHDRGDGVAVTLTDGSIEEVDLLVGADGVRSRVRTMVFGESDRFVRDLGFHSAAYVCSDADIARKLDDSALHMLDAPGLQVGAYPLGGDQVATLFTHRVDVGTPLPSDPCAELRRTYGSTGWLVPQLLEHCPEPTSLYYDRVAQIEMSTWSDGHVVLVGDACHAMSLLTGQGAGTALAGAEILAEQLRHSDSVATASARYEDRLRPLVEQLQAEGRDSAESFVPR